MPRAIQLLFLLFSTFGLVLAKAQAPAQDTVLIDFGTVASGGPYNNLSDGVAGSLASLNNTRGAATGYSITVTDRFNGVNTGGTQTPDPGTGFPGTATGDSFFGNTAPFAGATEPTGALRLGSLNPEVTYTLTFFASRTGVTDVREAKYVLTGATVDSTTLDASNNVATVVTLSLKPAADSSILIAVSPGPGNTNASGFYYLGALRMSYEGQDVPVVVTTPADTLLIDFGTVLSPLPWNNVTDARSDSTIALIDEEGRPTNVTLQVVDAFNNVNTAGTQAPDPALGLPATATGDSFFGNTTPFGGATEPTGAIELAGLDPNLEYSIRLFGSRTATDNREARYLVTGATVDSAFVDGASNADRIGEVALRPSSAGTIRVEASAGPRNTNPSLFYYLGAMTVSSDPTQAELDSVLVDFGSPARLAPLPWNNLTNPADGTLADLTNARGFATGYGITVVDSFNNINTDGTLNPAPALAIPPTAAGDSFFGNTAVFGGRVQPSGAVELTGLNPAIEYSLSVFASRTASDNREARYVFSGATVDSAFLNAASNSDEVATARLRPDADGRLRITASAGPNNTNPSKFYYLGALVLTYPQQVAAGPRELVLLDPNGGEVLQVGKTFDITWRSRNVRSVTLDYSTDAGVSFTRIDSVDAATMRYTWTIPDAATTSGLVRISADTLRDLSDSTFAISTDTTTCTIVVIGSSTAAGTGASVPDSSWVNRFRREIAGDNTRFRVVNLALGGYTTFHLLPTGSTRGNSVGIPVDTARNITAALRQRPYAVIVNLPSNDAARFFSVQTQLRNFELIDSVGRAGGARVYITTTQPRNFTNTAQIDNQRAVRDSIFARYGERAIDFWTPLAAPNGFIIDSLDSGDGIHVNDKGHRRLFDAVRAERLDLVSCDLLSSTPEVRGRVAEYGLRVFPNPVSGDRVYVDVGRFAERQEIDIAWLDMLGRELSSERQLVGSAGDVLTLVRPAGGNAGQVLYCRLTRRSDGVQAGITVLVQ